jgi:hypothetical protein
MQLLFTIMANMGAIFQAVQLQCLITAFGVCVIMTSCSYPPAKGVPLTP